MKKLIVLALMAAVLAVPAMAQEKPGATDKPDGKGLIEKVKQAAGQKALLRLMWREMTPEQRQAFREKARESLRKLRESNGEKWREMTREQRNEVRKRIRKQLLKAMWNQLTPEQKQKLRDKLKEIRQKRAAEKHEDDKS